MLARMWSNRNFHSLLMAMQNGMAILEDGLAVSHKTKHSFTIWSSNCAPRYLPRWAENLCSHKNLLYKGKTTGKVIESTESNRYLYASVHGSIIYNSQKVEATQMSIDRWMDKQNVVYTYNGILFSLKKRKEILITCYNVDETLRHYPKWNKPNTKRNILYDSTYMN